MSIDPEATQLTPVLVRPMEGRVGSTLVMSLLGTSPAIAFDRVPPFENSYLSYFVRLVAQLTTAQHAPDSFTRFVYGDSNAAGPLPFVPEVLDLDDFGRRGLLGLWEAFSSSVVEASTGRVGSYAEKYWGDLSPVFRAGIRPRIIALVRDPRDVVASVRAFNAKRNLQTFGRGEVASDAQHLRYLLAAISVRLREFADLKSRNALLVRYEDLVTGLEITAATISEFVGEQLDPASVLSMSDLADHVTAVTAEESIGRWRSDLPPGDVALIERKLSGYLGQFGYK